MAIANLAHLFFAKRQAKTNKQNSYRTKRKGVAETATFFARALRAIKRACRQHGNIYFCIFVNPFRHKD
jgi:hypothetical protein